MMLHGFTAAGLSELRRFVAEHGDLPAAGEIPEFWQCPHPARVDVAPLVRLVEGFGETGSEHDAGHAIALHQGIQWGRRVMADRRALSWMAVVPLREYTRRRWKRGEEPLAFDRIGTDYGDNALARLWWGADDTRVDNVREVCGAVGLAPVDDPYAFTRILFANVQEELGRRQRLIQSRPAATAFLAFVQRHPDLPTKAIQSAATRYKLGLSTVLADAFVAHGPDDGAHRVAPDGCRALVSYLEQLVDRSDAPGPGPAGQSPAKPGLLARWFRGRRSAG